jgi:PAS domain S-box-containing protein
MIVHSKHSAPSEEPASAGALVRMALIGAGMVLFAAVLPSLLLTAAPAGVATLPLAKSAAAIIAAAALPAAVGIAVIAVLTRHICRRWGRLAESRARNRAIVDNMIDGAIHIDHNGNLVALNAAAEGIFGRTSQEVRGRPLTTLLAGPDRNDIAARIRDGSGGDLGETREATGLRRDGSTFPLYLAISTVNVGAHPVYTAIVRDLTETRDRMQELAKARDDALAADRAKSQFLAVMSHEIRTPMNGLLGMLELLRDSQLSRQQQELIDTAEQSGNLLLNLINDILDLSKIEAGKLDVQEIDFDLRGTVEEITAMVASSVRDKDLEVASFVEPEVPGRVRGDPYRVRQVLMNLMGNAVKFTPTGEVVAHVTVEAFHGDEVLLRVRVRDTGIGIEPDVMPGLFRPFVQADSSTTRRYGGTGLGLIISKRLVELMGGEIGVDSTPQQGSTFWFTLRLRHSRDEAPSHSEDLRGVRVLIVDDNATNRLILERYLANWGALTESVVDGRSALDALRCALRAENPFALAILDLQMPEMDGLELAERISGDQALADTRLMMLSSMGHPGAGARRAGIAISLLKPVRQSLLRDAVVKVLGRTPKGAGIGIPEPPAAEPAPKPEAAYRARVLVAEDNPVNQTVAVAMLRRLGIDADLVENGQLAIEALAAHEPYDLVLMDVQMPVLGGLEATRRIRDACDGQDAIPIIAMTAAASNSDRDACLAAGMNDFVAKPFERAQLESVLRQWLPAYGGERASQ